MTKNFASIIIDRLNADYGGNLTSKVFEVSITTDVTGTDYGTATVTFEDGTMLARQFKGDSQPERLVEGVSLIRSMIIEKSWKARPASSYHT